MIDINIVNQRNIISMNANNGDFNPKNKIDHSVFNINCKANIVKAIFLTFDFSLLLQIIYSDIPIKKYNVIKLVQITNQED